MYLPIFPNVSIVWKYDLRPKIELEIERNVPSSGRAIVGSSIARYWQWEGQIANFPRRDVPHI